MMADIEKGLVEVAEKFDFVQSVVKVQGFDSSQDCYVFLSKPNITSRKFNDVLANADLDLFPGQGMRVYSFPYSTRNSLNVQKVIYRREN